MYRAVIGILLLSMLAVATASSWKSCGAPGDHGIVKSVQLYPDPPQRTVDETVNLQGTVDEQVTSGSVTIVITYTPIGIQVFSQTWAICNVVSCPVAPGPISANLTIPGSAIPSFAPSGAYVSRGTILDQNSAEIICVDTSFNLP